MSYWITTTEEQAKAATIQADHVKGRYKFKVLGQQEKISQSGNKYISLKIKVFTPYGDFFTDHNMVDTPKMFFQRKHFWESVGFPEKVNASPEYYLDQEGEADFDVEEYYSKKYDETRKKLVIIDFVSDKKTKEESPFEDDDIPF